VVSAFETVIAKIYGDQTAALTKIFQHNSDRRTWIVEANKQPVGLVVFKSTPDDEYNVGYESLEIKTLVITGKKNCGCGSFALRNLLKITEPHSLRVTINFTKPEVAKFFQHYGFEAGTVTTIHRDNVYFLRRT
jgi:hypothetical protein